MFITGLEVVEFDEFAVAEHDSETLAGKIPEWGFREGLLRAEVLCCAG
jgi:hypothetical protein